MSIAAGIAVALMTSHGLSHLVSTGVVARRLLARPVESSTMAGAGTVTLLRPVCGLENYIEEALRSSFLLTYPQLELLFCVDDADDPVVPIVQRLIAEYPAVDAELLVGRDWIGANPKLNNLMKGWRATRSEWVILSDSNAILPADFVEVLLSRWQADTGVVSTAASLVRPETFPAEIECAFVNSLQARWMLFANSAGFGFAQGRTLMWRRSVLERAGGLPALTAEAADELAATRAVRRLGLKARLAQRPLPQAAGRRSLAAVWRRQLRWARLRRAGLPIMYWGEIFVGAAVPFAAALALTIAGLMPPWALLAYIAAWYGLEAMLTKIGRWPLTARMPLAWIARDILLPAIWLAGFLGSTFVWRGKALSVATSSDIPGSQN